MENRKKLVGQQNVCNNKNTHMFAHIFKKKNHFEAFNNFGSLLADKV